MLLNDFYTVESSEKLTDSKYIFWIVLQAQHPIFEGHFPNNPVTPGVCMLQIVKELSENITRDPLFLRQATNVKFMALINPVTHPKLKLELEIIREEHAYRVKNVTYFDQTVALKMNNLYSIQ